MSSSKNAHAWAGKQLSAILDGRPCVRSSVGFLCRGRFQKQRIFISWFCTISPMLVVICSSASYPPRLNTFGVLFLFHFVRVESDRLLDWYILSRVSSHRFCTLSGASSSSSMTGRFGSPRGSSSVFGSPIGYSFVFLRTTEGWSWHPIFCTRIVFNPTLLFYVCPYTVCVAPAYRTLTIWLPGLLW